MCNKNKTTHTLKPGDLNYAKEMFKVITSIEEQAEEEAEGGIVKCCFYQVYQLSYYIFLSSAFHAPCSI